MTIMTEHIQPMLDTKRIPAALVAAILLCWCGGAAAQEHLMPAAERVQGYETGVAHVLKDALKEDVLLNSIVEPSFKPEYAVGIEKRDDGYFVFYLVANEAVWPKLLNKQSTDVGTSRCELPITGELAERVGKVWDALLSDLRSDEKYPDILDGTTYFFSKIVDGKLKIGMANDGLEDSNVGKLQDVGYYMKDLCIKKDEATAAKLDSKVNELLVRLQILPVPVSK